MVDNINFYQQKMRESYEDKEVLKEQICDLKYEVKLTREARDTFQMRLMDAEKKIATIREAAKILQIG